MGAALLVEQAPDFPGRVDTDAIVSEDSVSETDDPSLHSLHTARKRATNAFPVRRTLEETLT
jgi:hypothetical protein